MTNATHKPQLIPADAKRCQAEITEYHPFRLGGSVHQARQCGAVPSVIATEAKPGPDGTKGSMSMCASCLTQFIKQMPSGFATFQSIAA